MLQASELKLWDSFFRLRPAEPPDERIVIVELTEQDIQGRDGQEGLGFPVSDRDMARLIEIIREQEPRAIGFDFWRDIPIGPGHQELTRLLAETDPGGLAQLLEEIEVGYQELSRELAETDNLIGIETPATLTEPAIPKPPGLPSSRSSVPILTPDRDAIMRRIPIFSAEGLPNLGLKTALLYLEVEGIEANVDTSKRVWLQIEDLNFVAFEKYDGAYIRADAGDYKIIINYRRSKSGEATFERLSFSDALAGNFETAFFRDKIVFLGSSAESSKDKHYSPISLPLTTDGVELHAQVASLVLSAVLDNRPLIRVIPEPLEYLWIVSIASGISFLIWRQRHEDWFLLRGAAIALGSGASVGAIAYGAFVFGGWWFPIVPSWIGIGTGAIAVALYAYDRARDEKIAVAVHDVRNPLIHAGQFASILLEDLGDVVLEERYDDWERKLKIIQFSARRMDIVLQQLTLERQDSRTFRSSLNQLLLDAFETVDVTHSIHPKLITDLAEELDDVQTFGKPITIILDNLLRNAFDALKARAQAEKGNSFNPEIHLESRVTEDGFECLISDNGTGVPVHLRRNSRLFKPFVSSKGEGRGLGLASARKAARKIGASLSVSHLDRGTSFRLGFRTSSNSDANQIGQAALD